VRRQRQRVIRDMCLPLETIDSADYVVKIPMHHGVDSLNVAAASAIAFYEFTKKKQ
ncbi:MAG: hypothetical protein K2H72_02340, partial [Muribaculaceae bacterium]|nr:hypothetical protein [Muribaculaceae bacterium]